MTRQDSPEAEGGVPPGLKGALAVRGLADPAFHRLIARHLQQERLGVARYIAEMKGHLPFRSPE